MIILSIITLIFSFLLQGISSNYVGNNLSNLSWFITIYPLVNLLVLTPYFESTKKNIILIIIVGVLVDIVYANTFILNACLFVALYYISKAFHFFFPYNLFTLTISNILIIFLYHIISFWFLSLLKYDTYSLRILLNILTHSIIMTVLYSCIIYLIIEFRAHKKI